MTGARLTVPWGIDEAVHRSFPGWPNMRTALSLIRTVVYRARPARPGKGSAYLSQCLFCRRNDQASNRVLVENRTCYARHDNYPAADGHVEIVPKRHVESFFELTRREVWDAYCLILEARRRIDQSTETPQGYTIGVNEGRAAGRTVDHLHIHLIPRRVGDVADPRGGIRQVLPNVSPDAWSSSPHTPPDTPRTDDPDDPSLLAPFAAQQP